MGRQFCLVFNLRFRSITSAGRARIAAICADFLTWVQEFAQCNSIQFPNIDIFFGIIIYNSLSPSGLAHASKCSDHPDIKAIQLLTERLFGDSEMQALCQAEEYIREAPQAQPQTSSATLA
jgi:hypothetical protein